MDKKPLYKDLLVQIVAVILFGQFAYIVAPIVFGHVSGDATAIQIQWNEVGAGLLKTLIICILLFNIIRGVGLFKQVIVAILLGALFGYIDPALGIKMKPLGDGFINLIKMMIAPIIFCTIVSGVASMGNMKQVGRVGFKAIICFEVITTLALVIGLALVKFFRPGSSLNIDISKVDTSVVKHAMENTNPEGMSIVDFFMHVIPNTLISAFSSGEILQVLLVAILFASSLPSMPERGRTQILNFLDLCSHVLFKIVDVITKVAALGAFGAMAFTVGKFGIASLKDLGELVGIFYLTCFLFVLFPMWPLMHFYCKLNLWQFLRFIGEELLIVLGTSSSESVLPRIMEKLELLGCSKSVVGMVIPTGYSFNLVGSCIYFTMGALFITYATHTPISLGAELTLLGVLLIASKGAAGVSGSAFIVLAATLTSMKLMPQQNLDVGLALIFAVDRFMSTGRAITNLIGNGVSTIIVAKWEDSLNVKQAQEALRKGSPEL